MTIRPANVEDADAIARVHVHTWQVAYRGQIRDEILDSLDAAKRAEKWRSWFADMELIGSVFVAEDGDGSVVGFVNAGHSRDEDADDSTGEIRAIYVAPGHWDTGTGAALMRAALDALRERFRCATLWVLETNERGRRFYERGGWAPDGSRQLLEGLDAYEVRYRIDL